MEDFVKEGSFVIAESVDGSLYIFLEAKKESPETPRIMYDGNDHALFFRNNDQRIILDYINPEIRKKLKNSKKVIIVETILENIKQSYSAEVQIVSSLPIDLTQYDLKTWEDVD